MDQDKSRITIADVLARLTREKPYSQDVKTLVAWLSDLDGKLFTEHGWAFEGEELPDYWPYDDTLQNQVLVIPHPYTNVYILYLSMMIDLFNHDIEQYNNTLGQFNMDLQAYLDYRTRTMEPKNHSFRGIRYK